MNMREGMNTVMPPDTSVKYNFWCVEATYSTNIMLIRRKEWLVH